MGHCKVLLPHVSIVLSLESCLCGVLDALPVSLQVSSGFSKSTPINGKAKVNFHSRVGGTIQLWHSVKALGL